MRHSPGCLTAWHYFSWVGDFHGPLSVGLHHGIGLGNILVWVGPWSRSVGLVAEFAVSLRTTNKQLEKSMQGICTVQYLANILCWTMPHCHSYNSEKAMCHMGEFPFTYSTQNFTTTGHCSELTTQSWSRAAMLELAYYFMSVLGPLLRDFTGVLNIVPIWWPFLSAIW